MALCMEGLIGIPWGYIIRRENGPMKLYGYFRSSAAFRVRIALNLKGLTVEHVPVHLVRNGGEQKHKPFRLLNPQMLVPALELDDGSVLTQSLAIIEYLETVWPHPRVIPADPIQ